MNFSGIIDLASEGKIEEARQSLPLLNSVGADVLRKIAEAFILEVEGKYHESVKLNREALDLAKKGEIGKLILLSYSEYLVSLNKLSRNQEIIDIMEEVLEYIRSRSEDDLIKSGSHLASIYNTLGLACSQIGNEDAAREYLLKAIEYMELVGDTEGIAGTMGNIGIMLHDHGELEEALIYYNNALALIGDNNVKLVGKLKNNIGNLYSSMGELNKGLEYLLESLEIKEETSDQLGMANTLVNLGELYFKLGNIKTAEEMVKSAKSIYYELNLPTDLSYAILLQSKFAIHNSDKAIIEQCKSEMVELIRHFSQKIIEQRYELLQGLILISGSRLQHKVEARTHFEKIIRDPVLDFEIHVEALKNLIEINFLELSISGPTGPARKVVEQLLDQLRDFGKKSKSFSIVVESLILRAKLNLISKDYDHVTNLIQNAEIICEERCLKYQLMVIKDLKNDILNQLEKVEEIASTSNIMDLEGELNSYIIRLKKMRNSR